MKSSNLTVISPSTHLAQTESTNPLEGLTIKQMREKIEKEKLIQITILSSLPSIGTNTFSECSSLDKLFVDSANPNY